MKIILPHLPRKTSQSILLQEIKTRNVKKDKRKTKNNEKQQTTNNKQQTNNKQTEIQIHN